MDLNEQESTVNAIICGACGASIQTEDDGCVQLPVEEVAEVVWAVGIIGRDIGQHAICHVQCALDEMSARRAELA